jgi:hypothetical protein
MAIARLHQHFTRTLLTLSLTSLIACGGGGDNSPAPDTTPDAITFNALTNAEPNAVVASSAITISGINTAAPIVIVGGEYAIAGAAFTAAAGTISNGQTLVVRTTASDKTNTTKVTTITVGGVSATFTVTTLPDVTPDAFTFAPQTDAAFNTEYTSAAMTVSGIDVAVPVAITGGSYSINGGTFTQAAGTASAGQTISVKTTTGSATDTTHNAVLTVGGVTGTFAVSTVKDTTPPVAEFKFPTPYTMSEANSVKVRGTATDDNAITNVKVVVRSFNLNTPSTTLSTTEIDAIPKAETNGVKDFSSWTVDVPLTALAENEIKVIATDNKNNVIPLNTAKKVVVRQANVSSAFPDEVNEFADLRNSTIDSNNNRTLASERGKIFVVDNVTGQRSVFIEHEDFCSGSIRALTIDHQTSRLYGVCSGEEIIEFNFADGSFVGKYTIAPNPVRNFFPGLALDKVNGRNRLVLVEQVYEYDEGGGQIIGFSLDSKEFSVISEANELPHIKGSFGGIALDGDNYWFTSGGQHEDAALRKVIKVNAITGKRGVFSDNSIGSGELFSSQLPNGDIATLKGIVQDTKNNRLVVMDNLADKLLAIDLSTGERSLFKDVSYKGTTDFTVASNDLKLDEIHDFLLMSDSRRKAIIMVDLETREKVILSKSKNNF